MAGWCCDGTGGWRIHGSGNRQSREQHQQWRRPPTVVERSRVTEESPSRPPKVRAWGRQADKNGRCLEVYNEMLARLRGLCAATLVEISLAYENTIWVHFHRLPTR
uniref:Uncharacterized protein n=1 Tax=Oryza punctata TaxID=4537 RepID=A0A0E0LS92_ORYPU